MRTHVIVEEECGWVGSQDGGVDDQQQDEPVPHRLEGAVVQHRPLVDARSLQLVLRQHICTQRQHLCRERKTERGDQTLNNWTHRTWEETRGGRKDVCVHVCEGLRKYGKKRKSKETNVHTCTHTPSIYTVTEPNHRRWWELLSWLFPGRPPRQPVSITHVYNSAMQRYVHRNPCSKLTHT